jgi:hypothetical protein
MNNRLTMKDLNNFEEAVLKKLLSGDNFVLATLRKQAKYAILEDRVYTGVGFFCTFKVPLEAPVVKLYKDFQIDDVNGELEGLTHGAGFVLFVRDGRLKTLEGFSYDEPWPKEVLKFRLTYQSDPRDLSMIK